VTYVSWRWIFGINAPIGVAVMLGISSGMLRTFANPGMVFFFAVAILTASRSISRSLAFAIFVGTTGLHGHLAAAFTTGLHAAFYTLMAFMILAAVLSAARGRPAPAPQANR